MTAMVQVSKRGYKSLRNAGLFVIGFFVVLVSVVLPKMLGKAPLFSLTGAETVFADAPTCVTETCTSCSSCSCSDTAGCNDGGSGDCSGY